MRTTDNLVQALEGIQFSDPPSTKELWRLLNCIEKGLNVIFAHNPPLREIESLDIALGLLDVDLSGGADAARAELVDVFTVDHELDVKPEEADKLRKLTMAYFGERLKKLKIKLAAA